MKVLKSSLIYETINRTSCSYVIPPYPFMLICDTPVHFYGNPDGIYSIVSNSYRKVDEYSANEIINDVLIIFDSRWSSFCCGRKEGYIVL
jgi:hypothetical protein